MYLDLEEVRMQLRLDCTTEDPLVFRMMRAAEDYVSQYLNRPVPWCDSSGNDVPVPESVKHAAMMLIDFWYQNRASVLIGATSKELEFSTHNLLHFYRVGLGT